MVRAIRLASIALLLLLTVRAAEAQIDGLMVPTRVQIGAGEAPLVLNGAGTRRVGAFKVKVYVMALYLPTKTGDSEAILHANLPSRLYFRLLRDVTARQLESWINDALEETLGAEDRLSIEPRLKQLDAVLGASPELKKGTEIALDYLPRVGTTIQLNGTEKGRISGSDFREALLRIWIGDRSRDPSLRKALLGVG